MDMMAGMGGFGGGVQAPPESMQAVGQAPVVHDVDGVMVGEGETDTLTKKRRRRMLKLEQVNVKTRWACPRDANTRAKGPLAPMIDCVKCGGAGCDMMVFCGHNKAEEFVFVLSRNENGSSKYLCRDCGDTFSGTQSRIIAHKLQITGRGVAMCTIPASEEVRAALEPLDVVGVKGSTAKKRSTADSHRAARPPKDKERIRAKDEADVAVALFFFECGVPVLRSQEPAFRRMLRAVAAHGEGYSPPDFDRIADGSPREATVRLRGAVKPAGLLYTCLQAVRREQEQAVQSTARFGSTLASDGARHFGVGDTVSTVLATPKGRVFVGTSEAGAKEQERAAEFLAEDAGAALRKLGDAANVFLLVMDGPPVCLEALRLFQRAFPRVQTAPCGLYACDELLVDVGRRFAHEVVAPVHRMLLHVTNHPLLHSVFEGLEGEKRLLQPAAPRLSAEVLCVRAFLQDKNAIKLLWSHPTVSSWLDEREPLRAGIRDRHSSLGLEFVHKPDWWRLLEACVALMEAAVPLLREPALEAPNLWKMPSLFDQACAELQGDLALNGQPLDAQGLAAGGARVAGRAGDGSVQGGVLEAVRARRDLLVSEVALAAAMVYPPLVFQDPYMYEPEGGRAAFNAVVQRHHPGDEDQQVAVLTGLSALRSKQGAFGTSLAKRLAFSDALTFYDTLCVDAALKPLADLALKLLSAPATLTASDRPVRLAGGLGGSAVVQERLEQQLQVRMHHRLRPDAVREEGRSARTVIFDVRQHWLAQRRAALLRGGGGGGGLLRLADVSTEEDEPLLDQDVPFFVEEGGGGGA